MIENIWKKYKVTISIRDMLFGGVPRNPEVIKSWIESKASKEHDSAERQVMIEDAIDNTEAVIEKMWCGFKSDEKGVPYIEERHIKALLKEASTVLKLRLKSAIAKGVFVKPEKISLNMLVSGSYERTIHVSTMLGKRSALKKNDYVVKPNITFELWVSSGIPLTQLKLLFEAGSEIGLGDSRTLGFGKYDYKIDSVQ